MNSIKAQTSTPLGLLTGLTAGAAVLAATCIYAYSSSRTMPRTVHDENVIIVGASSGVGLELALHYARQTSNTGGKKVNLHLVARRSLTDLEKRCKQEGASDVSSSMADASDPKDVLRLYQDVKGRWDRVDTIIVCAGALTVLPVLNLSGQATSQTNPSQLSHDTGMNLASLSRVADVAARSYSANVTPSLLLTTAFLPLLLASESPRIAVLSSVAAEIPAPTRAIYAANKAAASMLMRSLRIELEGLLLASDEGADPPSRRKIGITLVHPASIDTGLRSSALDLDSSPAASSDDAAPASKERKAMSPSYVAEEIVTSIAREEDEVWLPRSYWWISKVAMVLLPDMVKQGARKKYGFL